MLDSLWKLLFGYVTIQADGMLLERFINACEANGLALSAVRRISRIRLSARIAPRHLRRVRRIADQARCQITVLSRHGFYALWGYLAHRPVLIVGLCVALFLGILSTQFVLDVRVSGVDDAQAKEILEIAGQYGAKPGALWGHLDQQDLQRHIEMQAGFVRKILVHKRGMVLLIEAIPGVDAPPLFQTGDVCDIVASRNAVVQSVIALDGTPCVKPGEVVRRGDVLIRGTFARNMDEGKQRFVQARGIVLGRVSCVASARVSLSTYALEKTGRIASVRSIHIAGWVVSATGENLFAQSILLHRGETTLVGSVLPASVNTSIYAEAKRVPCVQTYAQAEARGASQARSKAQKMLPAGVSSMREMVCSRLTGDGAVEVRVYLTAVVPIGMENKQMIQEPLLNLPRWW